MQSHSIGIIGGADGPTAVFITGSPNGLIFGGAAIILIAALICAAAFFRKK